MAGVERLRWFLLFVSLFVACSATVALMRFGSAGANVSACGYLFAIYVLLLVHMSRPGGGS